MLRTGFYRQLSPRAPHHPLTCAAGSQNPDARQERFHIGLFFLNH